jgi:hypothetical protein
MSTNTYSIFRPSITSTGTRKKLKTGFIDGHLLPFEVTESDGKAWLQQQLPT